MQWIISLFRGRQKRDAFGRRGTMMLSVLALAVGATLIGMRRDRLRKLWQRMLQPFRNRIPE